MQTVLAKLAVLAVVVSIGNGVILTKCDVRDHFEAVLKKLPRKLDLKINVEKLIAIATCHVEHTSGFNTSAVQQLTVGGPGKRPKRSPPHGASKYDLAMISSKPTKRPPGSEVWTLYGIFQLPDRVLCNSGLVPSLNICKTNCTNFLDDDVDDDIACIEELTEVLLSGQRGEVHALLKKVHSLLFQKECMALNYDEYFAGCP